ncbi:unannotated protein [freshwater metagenome]|uniref:Unannotated protein n=1 Tax=freshwater metagenome TaxID=449393 RepID=A0A6J6I594_9ZZZZ
MVPRNGEAATDAVFGADDADNVGTTDVLTCATGFAAACTSSFLIRPPMPLP